MATNSTPAAPKTTTHTVAQWVGHPGTHRIITKADQDALIGVKGVAKADLEWPIGSRKVDVTEADDAVIEYLKSDENFKVGTVEVPVSEEAKA